MSVWTQETVSAVDVDGNSIRISRPYPGQVVFKVVSANGNLRATLDFDADDALLFLEYAHRVLGSTAKVVKR